MVAKRCESATFFSSFLNKISAVFSQVKKPTVTELIETHVNERIPVMSDGTLLIKGVPRTSFYILHEHVEIGAKLGGGAFGDVFAGRLTRHAKESTEIAIKQMRGTTTASLFTRPE